MKRYESLGALGLWVGFAAIITILSIDVFSGIQSGKYVIPHQSRKNIPTTLLQSITSIVGIRAIESRSFCDAPHTYNKNEPSITPSFRCW